MEESKRSLILNVLRDGRKRWLDLERELVKSGKMAKATLSSNLKSLEMDGKIKRITDNSKRPPVTWYVLAELYLPLKQKVRSVLEELRQTYRFLKEPSVKEVAAKLGKKPEVVSQILYELAPKTLWKEYDNEEQVKEKAKEIINLAGWLKWLRKGDESEEFSSTQVEELNRIAKEEVQRAPSHIIKKAEKLLKNYPELVPKAKPTTSSGGPHSFIYAPAGLDPWPEEIEEVWRRIFYEEAPITGRRVSGAVF